MHPIGLWFSTAAVLLVVNALLHLLAFVPGGFKLGSLQFLLAGLLYLALAFGLWQQWRWVLVVQLIVGCLGGALIMLLWPASILPNAWILSIIILDGFVAILCLMILLPQRRRR